MSVTSLPPSPPAEPPQPIRPEDLVAPPAGRRGLTWLVVLGVLAAGAAGVAMWHPWRKPPVTVPVERRALQEVVDVSGSVEAIDAITLRAEASGRVLQRPVQEDQAVTPGRVLLALDDSTVRLQLAQARTQARMSVEQAETALASARAALAEAILEQHVNELVLQEQTGKADRAEAEARRELARNADLAADGAVTTQQMDSLRQQRDQATLDARIARGNLAKVRAGAEVLAARNQVAQANSALVTAQQQGQRAIALAQDALTHATLRAPVAGRVTQWLVAPGDFVAAGTPVGTFLDPHALRLKLPVDELDLPKLGAGQGVTIAFDAFPEETFRGRIARIGRASQTGDAGVQAFPVEVSFDDPRGRVRPGMNADAHVLVREVQDALAVPLGAVRRQGQQLVVTRLTPKGRQETVVIQPGISTLAFIQAKSGVEVGDRLVLPGAVP